MEEWGNPSAELLKLVKLRIVSSTSESITIAARSSKGPLPSCFPNKAPCPHLPSEARACCQAPSTVVKMPPLPVCPPHTRLILPSPPDIHIARSLARERWLQRINVLFWPFLLSDSDILFTACTLPVLCLYSARCIPLKQLSTSSVFLNLHSLAMA